MGEIRPHDTIKNDSLMMQVLDKENLILALKQVKRNKGAAGIDGMTVEALPEYLKHHWLEIKAQLLEGRYRPQAVRRIEIPKSDGRKRKLGIPSVVDRFIQQAIAQVLRWIWEPQFHPNSYGFRLMRSAHQAVVHAQSEILKGRKWVVDLDLDSFFDRVNHDRLMHKLKEKIEDKTLLRLINRYLKSGVSIKGKYKKTEEGVPQGSPLSPLLSNIILDEPDWEPHPDDFIAAIKRFIGESALSTEIILICRSGYRSDDAGRSRGGRYSLPGCRRAVCRLPRSPA